MKIKFYIILSLLILTSCVSTLRLLFTQVDTTQSVYIRDSDGRIVIYRGVNHSNYSKISKDNLPWHDGSEYQRLSREWGFNLVRFQIFWSAVEPQEGQINFDYIYGVNQHIQKMEEAGLSVLLDWHQDLYAEKFSGNGFPSWAIYDNDISFTKHEPWHLNYKEPAVIAAFTNFWNNKNDIQDKCIETMSVVLRRLSDRKNIIGIGPINEPFPGLHIATFEKEYLSQYYRRVENMLAKYNLNYTMFFEPVIFATVLPTLLDFEPTARSIYAPHYYDAMIDYGVSKKYVGASRKIMTAIIEMRVIESQKMRVPLLIGEFGMSAGVKNRNNFYMDFVDLSNKYMFGWTVWCYDLIQYSSMGLIDGGGKEQDFVRHITSIYAQRIAGNNPKIVSKDGKFTLTYTPDKRITMPTELFIPPRYSNVMVSENGESKRPARSGNYVFYEKGSGTQKVVVTWDKSKE